ncbi:Tetranectin [Bulinus truncatus]|nr:Tetranectin [Bulinus truncatus]
MLTLLNLFVLFGCFQETFQRDCLGSAFSELSKMNESLQKKIQQLDHLISNQPKSDIQGRNNTDYKAFGFNEIISVGDKTFLLSDVKIKNAYAANHVCSFYGGFLAEIENQSEYDGVVNVLNTQTNFTDCVWIGINDEAKEGEFVYTHSKRPAYTVWMSGEPNKGKDENCAWIDIKVRGEYKKMYDAGCIYHKHCQIMCQLDQSSTNL